MSASSTSQHVVFLSHSHADRRTATELNAVLKKNGARTYLDQEMIEVSDVLPDRLREGVTACTDFILIWSASARSSRWVREEWNLAYDRRKRILPYCLDATPLPSPLDALVFVPAEDRNLAYSNLLTAMFGRAFHPAPGEVFAGTWQADFNAFGLLGGTATLELRKNGQVIGSMRLGLAGLVGAELGGMGGLEIPVNGSWKYEPGTRVLELNTTASGFGTTGSETVHMIVARGHESGPIQGRDLAGRTWVLRRLGTT